jgi:hypothetical protein
VRDDATYVGNAHGGGMTIVTKFLHRCGVVPQR